MTIRDHIHAEGGSPSLGQIAIALEMSKATVYWYVKQLEKDDYIRRSTDHRRLIYLTGKKMK